MKAKKVYCYTTSIAWSVVLLSSIVGMLVLVILFPNKVWFLLIGIFLLLLVFWYMFATGQFTPIYLSEKGIKYRGKELDWQDLKITAVVVPNRGYIESYFLMFSINFFESKEDIKIEKRRGFYVYLKEKPLNQILQHYKNKILIVNRYGNIKEINSTKKINDIVQKHNHNAKE